MTTIENVFKSEFFRYTKEYPKKFLYNNVKEYDPQNNYYNALLSALVYDSEPNIKNQIKLWNTEDTSLNLEVCIKDIESYRFMVVSNRDLVIVVFRGSDNISNWLNNADIRLMPYDNMQGVGVHSGFYKSVLDMKSSLKEVIKDRRQNRQHLYYTGHSLGGAQALLAASLLRKEFNFEFANVTTYGAPPPGEGQLSIFLNENLNSSPPSTDSYIYRFVNRYDPVPYSIKNYLLRAYFHAGFFFIFTDKGKYEITTTKRHPEYIIDTPSNISDKLYFSSFKHAIDEYINNALINNRNSVF